MQRDFVTVDVFTDRRFGGNPLAVVLNGQGLSAAQMQVIAGEFNGATGAWTGRFGGGGVRTFFAKARAMVAETTTRP